MKKKLIICCFVAIAAVSAVLYVQSKSSYQDDLLLANVEALAEAETTFETLCLDARAHVCLNDQNSACYFLIPSSGGGCDIKCYCENYRNTL